MMSEQINLAALKKLMDNAKYLKAQLRLMSENLDAVSKERDELAVKEQSKYAAALSNQEELKKQHLEEIQQMRVQFQNEIDALSSAKNLELQNTINRYESKLEQTTKDYEAQIQTVSNELREKNDELQETLKKLQASYDAVVNRIRGISS